MRPMDVVFVGAFVLAAAGIGLVAVWSQLAIVEDEYAGVKCAHPEISLAYREAIADECATLAQLIGILRAGLAFLGFLGVVGSAAIIKGLS